MAEPDDNCRLANDMKLCIAPQDKGEPPAWVPPGFDEIHWVGRTVFDELKKRRNEMPCDICPINDKCEVVSD